MTVKGRCLENFMWQIVYVVVWWYRLRVLFVELKLFLFKKLEVWNVELNCWTHD